MAKRRRKATRRSNPTRIVVRSKNTRRRTRRSANPVSHRRRTRVSHRRRRNPELFGRSVTASQMAQAVVGGLVGVTAAKIIPGMVPASFTASPIMRLIVTGAAAFGAGMLAKKVSPAFGDAVLFGGLMQTGSQLLNSFLPSVGSRIGLGELVSGSFPIPQNPIRAAQLGPSIVNAPSVRAAGGMGRAYGSAY